MIWHYALLLVHHEEHAGHEDFGFRTLELGALRVLRGGGFFPSKPATAYLNMGRTSSRRIFCITPSGTLSSGAKPVSGLVASRPILALTPPAPAEGSSSLPCALGMTTKPRSA